MINILWMGMILISILWAGINGKMELVTTTIFTQASKGMTTSLELMAIVAVWLGLSRIAEKAGLLRLLTKLMTPFLRPLFPGVPPNHPSLSSISMNLAANLFGLANAATPFGLKAMKELQKLNYKQETATPAMITFLALNTAAPTLVPATAIALRATAGSPEPSSIIIPAALASIIATVTVLFLDYCLRRRTLG